MRECTITSKKSALSKKSVLYIIMSLLLATSLVSSSARAQGSGVGSIPPAQDNTPQALSNPSALGGGDPNAPAIPTGHRDEPNLFDQSSPYLEYGDFNMNEEENQDALYFQYGRFFGISLGLGYENATGNRGKLYDPALRFDIRIHYWFDFNFAMDLGVFFANHSFTDQGTVYQPKLLGYGVHLIYYFDVRDASAPITFANPFIEAGVGQWSISQTSSLNSATPDTDSTLSVDFGGGLEFPIVYKKTYFIIEALYHTQNFADSAEDKYSDRVPDLTGGFFTLMAHFMFVW
jgi:hypothetical protein